MITYAYCFASGQIEFGTRIPDGALPLGRGRSRIVREVIEATARRAYDGETLLVPGIPEAPDQAAALDALLAFRSWIGQRKRHGFRV
jgi:hypothetical protein